MKHCARCEQELPEPVDEFGDIDNPICISCFLNPESSLDEITKAEIEDQIKNLKEEKDALEDQLMDINRDICELKKQLKPSSESLKITKKDLVNWIEGNPIQTHFSSTQKKGLLNEDQN